MRKPKRGRASAGLAAGSDTSSRKRPRDGPGDSPDPDSSAHDSAKGGSDDEDLDYGGFYSDDDF